MLLALSSAVCWRRVYALLEFVRAIPTDQLWNVLNCTEIRTVVFVFAFDGSADIRLRAIALRAFGPS
jgi:hypothetical protein